MVRVQRAICAFLITTALGACGSPDTQPSVERTASVERAGDAGPYADMEQRMSDAMMTAVGTDMGDNWSRKMVAHHQGAIDMSQLVLQQNPTAQVAAMARTTIEKQGKEIDTIEKLFENGVPDRKSAEAYRAAMMDMHMKMQAATGADPSETYLRKMLEHHRGAVAMSDIALENGTSGPIRAQVQKTRDDQQSEIEMVEAMLSGKTIDHSAHNAPAAAISPAKPKPSTSPKASPKVSTAPAKPDLKASPAAEPMPSASPSCAPEHRAAGHC